MAQNQTSQPTSTPSNQNDAGARAVVTGKVTDARTGANLKGARVSIEETGQWTRTNDLGQFRFVNVPTGSATLSVSFLGYASQSVAIRIFSKGASQNFALRGGTEIEEIVVFGQQYARAQAINQERTAPNSTSVISSDQLGAFNGSTISEAIRRAPGIAFVPDSETGDGAQVIVRGLEPDLNQVTINGVRLLDGTGVLRSPDLSGILTESIESVTINKTLLPSQESNGAGALIEIETKSPLDRETRFATLGLEYGERSGVFGDEFGATGTLSGIFGSDESFGASISAAYREEENSRIEYSARDVRPEVLPATNEQGEPVRTTFDLNPLRQFPFDEGFDRLYPIQTSSNQGAVETETFTLSGTVQKQLAAHTDLRFDAVYTSNTQTSFTNRAFVSGSGAYDTGSVEGLDGDRPILVGQDIYRNSTNPILPVFFGDGIPGLFQRFAEYLPNRESTSLSLSFRGETTIDEWDVNYSVGWSEAEFDSADEAAVSLSSQFAFPSGILGRAIGDESFFNEQALSNRTADGRLISIFPDIGSAGAFVTPLFSEAGFAFYNSPDSLPLRVVTTGPRSSFGEELDLGGSVRRSFADAFVDYFEVGGDYREASFFSPDVGFGAAGRSAGDFSTRSDLLASDLGVVFGPGILTEIGAIGDFNSLDQASVIAVVNSVESLVESGALVANFQQDASRESNVDTEERFFNAYFEGKATFGVLEVIGGVRFENVEVTAGSFTGPRVIDADGVVLVNQLDDGEFFDETVDQSVWLPRVLANFRIDENKIIRAGYYRTASRPQLGLLTQRREIELDSSVQNGNFGERPVLTIESGNPDLKPATTDNYSLDFEWYFDEVGVLKISAFYKAIENSLQTNATFQTDGVDFDALNLPDIDGLVPVSENTELRLFEPANSDETDELWGAEITLERQFLGLPGAFSGLGIYANYAHADSDGTQRLRVSALIDPREFVEVDSVQFAGSPEHSGTLGLTYRKYGFDASLFYTGQSRRLESLGQFGINNYNEAIETVDFRVDYTSEIAGRTVRIYFRGEDLLSDDDDPFLETSIGSENGVPKFTTGRTYLGGRSLLIGANVSF